MTTPFARAATAMAFGLTLALTAAAHAQSTGTRGGLLDDLFGGSSRSNGQRVAQMSETEMVVRIDRLENHIRQLTGAIEQLQFRNQQLEQTLRKMQEDNEYRFQQLGAKAAPETSRPVAQQPTRPVSPPIAVPAQPQTQPGRRSDVFDPTQHPNAPGAPRPLGGGSMVIAGPEPGTTANQPPIGIPGGREAGAPLDLATLARPASPEMATTQSSPVTGPVGTGALPPPPPRNTSATGALSAVQPPSQSPDDEYDLAYGYMLRKDYALAEDAFRKFLKDHPGERRAAEATYWLGESMFQRQRYRDAAESYLTVTTKHEKSAKAPEALYRLGQALAALGENEAACAALSEVSRKYPRASANVKQAVQREQKRVRC